MKDSVFMAALEAMANEIDRLKGEVFIRDCRIEKLNEENKKLNDDMQDLMDALKSEEVDDGML
jgi:uncharacterized protein (UPF0335 family)